MYKFLWHMAVKYILPRAIRYKGAPKVKYIEHTHAHKWSRDSNGVYYNSSEAFFAREDGVVVGKLTYGIHGKIYQEEFKTGLSDMDNARIRAEAAERTIEILKRRKK